MNPAAISARSEIIRRIFIPRSVMGNGIRSATPVVPGVSAEDAIPETWRPPASPLITAEDPKVVGTLLARQGALRQQARPPVRRRLRDQRRFTVALGSAARTSANPLSAIRLSRGRVSATLPSDPLETRDLDQAHPYLGARASITLAASADLATEGLAAAWVGAGLEGSAGMATVGEEAFGPATVTVGARAFWERALVGAGEDGALA